MFVSYVKDNGTKIGACHYFASVLVLGIARIRASTGWLSIKIMCLIVLQHLPVYTSSLTLLDVDFMFPVVIHAS